MRVHLFFASLLVLGTGCRQDPTVVVPPSFERPGAVAFFCVDVGSSSIVPLAQCDGLDGVSTEDRALTALVAQTASGEVASVDLRLDRVIDADLRVPGFTFKRVGEVPAAIVVNPEDSAVTYVASFGSRRVEYYDTADFREDVDRGAGLPETEFPWVALPDGPTDLMLAPDGSALFATLPTMGMIAVIPINADRSIGTPGTPEDPGAFTLVPITVPDPMPLAFASTRAFDAVGEGDCEDVLGFAWTGRSCEPVEGCTCVGADCGGLYENADLCTGVHATAQYQRICPTDLALRAPTLAEPEQLIPEAGTLAEPRRFRMDGDTLLVLDDALPIVHRFTVEGDVLTPIEPFAPGVPVQDLVFTPEVPRTVGSSTDVERFLYAIDATDGSVLVMDALEGSPTFGAVVPVHSGAEQADRIRLFDQARTLEVITPGFPGADCVLAEPESPAEPDRMRGVFVAIGLGNGLVEMIDVHDLDATCRGGDGSCESPLDVRDERVFIRRHAPRIGSFVTVASSTIGTPTFSLEGNTGRLTSTGVSESGGPGLMPGECPTHLSEVFPNASGEVPLICSVSEPWAARQERWEVDWEGAIPGATSGFARFDEGEPGTIQLSGARFCERGVLGRQNIADGMLQDVDPELGYEGDQVFITSDPPDSNRDNEVCEQFFVDENGSREEIAMPIVDAYQDRLVVDGIPPELRDCYTGESGATVLFAVEVRVREAFAVEGTRSGFVHRVEPDDAGRCFIDRLEQPIVDGEPRTYRNARAFDGRRYINPWISFSINNAATLVSGDRSTLSFAIGDVPPALVADIGDRGTGRVSTIVQGLHYSSTDERLYVVDSNTDGLIQYTLAPFRREQTFE